MAICKDCGNLCMCRVVGSDCIEVLGTGDADTPYAASLVISPAGATAGLSCGIGGLSLTLNCAQVLDCIDICDILGDLPVISGAAYSEMTLDQIGFISVSNVSGCVNLTGGICEKVQDCVGPMLGWMTGFDYVDGSNRWEAVGAAGAIATTDGAGNVSFITPGAAAVAIATVASALTGGTSNNGTSTINNGDTLRFRAQNGITLNMFPDTFVDVGVSTSGTWGAGPLTFGCANTNGAPIYVDSAGQIRTVPDHTAVQGGRNGLVTTQGTAGPGGYGGPTAASTINNPSPCRSMVVGALFTMSWVMEGSGFCTDAEFSANLNAITYSGSFRNFRLDPSTTAGSTADILALHASNNGLGTLIAGGTLTVDVQPTINIVTGGSGNITMETTAALWGVTQ